ncbi:hypothetical protein Tco_0762359 [Tanacetum coccineum]
MGDHNWNSFKSKEYLRQHISKDQKQVKVQKIESSFRLHANTAHFQREQKPKTSLPNVSNRTNVRKNTSVEASRNKMANSENLYGSYGHAMKKGTLNNDKEKEMKPTLVLDESCFIDCDLTLSLTRELKEFSSLSNLKVVLTIEYLNNINIKYMGDFWIMIKFQSNVSKENLLSHVGVGSWFSNLQQASELFYVDERVAWIDIERVPMKVWKISTFTKIISKWGDFIYEEEL